MHNLGIKSECVSDKIIEYIKEQHLTNGQKLPSIRQLSKVLEINPNMIRDGLMRLEMAGLLIIHPRAGTFARSVDYSSVIDIFRKAIGVNLSRCDKNLVALIDVRRLVETEIIAKMIKRADDTNMYLIYQALDDLKKHANNQDDFVRGDERFHLSIAKASGNEVLEAILDGLLVALRPYRLTEVRTHKQIQQALQMHEEIYVCIADRNTKKAQAKLLEHIDYRFNEVMRQINNPLSLS